MDREIIKMNTEEDIYLQRDRFNSKHNLYLWLLGGSSGVSILDAVVLTEKVIPASIAKAFAGESHTVFTNLNNALAIGLAIEGIVAIVSSKKSSTYGRKAAQLDGAIASHELELVRESDQPSNDSF
jgi:hypothetical protein